MKKTVQNLFTLVIAVLLIINTLPSMVYADEEIPVEDPSQAQVEVISEMSRHLPIRSRKT